MNLRKLLITSVVLLVLILSGCDLPEMTPLIPEVTPTVTSLSPTAPGSTETIATETVPSLNINSKNASQLTLTQKAAVSNIQKMVWSQDSQSLAVVTQNSDSGGNQIFGVTTLDGRNLSTLAVLSTQNGRISALAPDGHTIGVINDDQLSFKVVDALTNTITGFKTLDFPIMDLSFSSDLRYLAVTSQVAWEVVLFDLDTLEEVRVLTGFETASPVFNAGFDQSPHWVVWHARGTIQLQEVETGTMGQVFSHEDFVNAYTVSPDGTILASSAAKTMNGNSVPVISVWDSSTGVEIRTLEVSSAVNSLAFSPDGKLLAAAIGKEIQIWDPAAGLLIMTLSGHLDNVLQVAFSPDQRSIVTTSMDNQLYLWQVTR